MKSYKRCVAKRKTTKKRTAELLVQDKWIAELEAIAVELRTSTVSFSRERLLELAQEMRKARGEEAS